MRKSFILAAVLIVSVSSSYAQYGPRYGNRGGYHRQSRQDQSDFDPSFNLSIGYGFPNLDYYLLDEFYGYYHGSSTYTGPIVIDASYQFNPRISIGIMATYGKVSRSYYSFDTNIKTFTGSLTNTSVMLDFVRYMPASKKVAPYIRTAIGFNTGMGKYLDQNGQKFFDPSDGTTFAYQAGLGVQFYMSKMAGFFVEAGYGKYIISGGLALKFK